MERCLEKDTNGDENTLDVAGPWLDPATSSVTDVSLLFWQYHILKMDCI